MNNRSKIRNNQSEQLVGTTGRNTTTGCSERTTGRFFGTTDRNGYTTYSKISNSKTQILKSRILKSQILKKSQFITRFAIFKFLMINQSIHKTNFIDLRQCSKSKATVFSLIEAPVLLFFNPSGRGCFK